MSADEKTEDGSPLAAAAAERIRSNGNGNGSPPENGTAAEDCFEKFEPLDSGDITLQFPPTSKSDLSSSMTVKSTDSWVLADLPRSETPPPAGSPPPLQFLDGPEGDEVRCECEEQEGCERFMELYVSSLFNPLIDISPFSPLRARFNALCVEECGRREFARQVTTARVDGMELGEVVFLRLAAHCATLLHLADAADDIESAKVLMILAFTFQCEGRFLYEELSGHPIWQSMRFWSAAFLHAVHTERKLRVSSSASYRHQSTAERAEAAEVQRNTFFGQLSSFISNMAAFNLPPDQIAAFREKMVQMADLDPDQVEMLREMSPAVLHRGGDESEEESSFSEKFDNLRERGRSMLKSMSKSFTFDFGLGIE